MGNVGCVNEKEIRKTNLQVKTDLLHDFMLHFYRSKKILQNPPYKGHFFRFDGNKIRKNEYSLKFKKGISNNKCKLIGNFVEFYEIGKHKHVVIGPDKINADKLIICSTMLTKEIVTLKGLEYILEGYSKNKRIKSLEIHIEPINVGKYDEKRPLVISGVSIISESFKKNDETESLAIQSGNEYFWVDMFSPNLKKLKKLSLIFQFFGSLKELCFEKFESFICGEGCLLKELELRNFWYSKHKKEFERIFRKGCRVEKLKFSSSCIMDDGKHSCTFCDLITIYNGLVNNKTIKKLHFSNVRFGPNELMCISKLLRKNCSIEKLIVEPLKRQDLKIEENCYNHLFVTLEIFNRSLKILVLDFSGTFNKKMKVEKCSEKYLGFALKENKILKTIKLQFSGSKEYVTLCLNHYNSKTKVYDSNVHIKREDSWSKGEISNSFYIREFDESKESRLNKLCELGLIEQNEINNSTFSKLIKLNIYNM